MSKSAKYPTPAKEGPKENPPSPGQPTRQRYNMAQPKGKGK
jgi:hypothetical protein